MDHSTETFLGDFLKHCGMKHFYCERVYSNRSLQFISTAPFSIFPFVQRILPDVMENEMHSFQSFDILLDEYLSSETLDTLREDYGIFHPVASVRRYRTYYDIFWLSMGEYSSFAASFYLCNIEFIRKFQDTMTRRMDETERKKRHTGISMIETIIADPNFDNVTLDTNQRYKLLDTCGNETYLTSLEFFSSQLIAQGRSYKDIGSMFNISPRTVETYVKRAKERTGYTTKHDMLNAIRFFEKKRSVA